jgi:hypothetical protein
VVLLVITASRDGISIILAEGDLIGNISSKIPPDRILAVP